jgi:ketosteroid isomerase-like protein
MNITENELKALRELARDFFTKEVVPRHEEFVAQGNLVIVLGTVGMRTIATGREWATRFAHAITVRDGLVRRYEAIFDTAACVPGPRTTPRRAELN